MGKTMYANRLVSIANALACDIDHRVRLIGVIVEYSLPRRSKGTDYHCALRIVDASHHSCGFLLNFFAESKDDLPRVASAGDIIIVSRVKIQYYNEEIYALFNKNFSAFALYERKYGHSTPYQASSKFSAQTRYEEFVADLRKWMDSVQLDIVSSQSVLLREIRIGEQLDLVCKIIYMCEVNQDELMLFVWDGTDAPPIGIQERLDNEKESPLPLQLEGERLSRDILAEFPTVGTVLRVKVAGRKGELDPSLLIVGKWVKLMDLAFEVHAGVCYGMFAPHTKLRYVLDEDRRILKCLSDSKERFLSKWDRMPFTSISWPPLVTETEAEDVALVTLMDIINYSQVTAKFKCIVRVVAMLPSSPKDFRSPNGIYRIRLTLEDPTARIHALVYGEDAEMLFDGYPGNDELTHKRNKLLGIAEADGCREAEDGPRNPSWMLCCIKSYYVDESNKWESRNYGIFGTKLIC